MDKKRCLIGYIIEYKTINSQEWKRLNEYPVPGPACLVDGLIPDGNYQFRLTAAFKKEQEDKKYHFLFIARENYERGPPSEPSASKSSFMAFQ